MGGESGPRRNGGGVSRVLRLVTLLIACSGAFVMAEAVGAERLEQTTTAVTGSGTSDGGVVVVSGGSHVDGSGGTSGGGTSTVRCRYFELADQVSGQGTTAPVLGAEAGALVPLSRYWKVCVDTATGAEISRTLFDAALPDPGVVARDLAEEAFAQLRVTPPVARSNPAGGIAVINIPTWLWVDDWVPLRSAASAAGVTATVTATPVGVVWDPGDGSDPLSCGGPGVAYDVSRPAVGQSTDCSFTYTRAAGRFTITATQRWHVTYTATNGQSGDLGEVTSTAALPIDVRELVTSIGLDNH